VVADRLAQLRVITRRRQSGLLGVKHQAYRAAGVVREENREHPDPEHPYGGRSGEPAQQHWYQRSACRCHAPGDARVEPEADQLPDRHPADGRISAGLPAPPYEPPRDEPVNEGAEGVAGGIRHDDRFRRIDLNGDQNPHQSSNVGPRHDPTAKVGPPRDLEHGAHGRVCDGPNRYERRQPDQVRIEASGTGKIGQRSRQQDNQHE
jgi:hypothetical protein